MESAKRLYCRFCAQCKSAEKLLDLQSDMAKCEETVQKLAQLNTSCLDISEGSLPKTVCFVCCDALNKACEFLSKLERAQAVLTDIFTRKTQTKSETSDDDDEMFDVSFLDLDAPTAVMPKITGIKTEIEGADTKYLDAKVSVKVEPKEESEPKPTEPNMAFDASLNVQELLDAAMSDSFDNLEMYAKELPVKKKKHSIKRWSDYPWLCLQCNKAFEDVQLLRNHSREDHNVCSAFSCIDCSDPSLGSGYDVFVSHVRKHRKSLKNQCHYCDIKSDNIKAHLKSHSNLDTACPNCGEIFNSESSLLHHIESYSTSKPKKTRRKRGMPITVTDLTCDLCHKVYKNPNSLRDHKKLHLERKRNYTCERCGKTFFNKGTLTTHILSHDKVRPYVCKICNRSFLFPNMLRRHVEMHSGVKPYSCEQCGRCFRLQYQLKAHKIIHTDKMPHVCSYCNKAFRFKQILKNHERQHTGSKPYSCQICAMEFTNWSNYNKHMKRRHGLDTSKKKITPEGVFPVNPETGHLIQIEDPVATEMWRNEIMVPGKRGKKKVKVEASGQ